MTYELLLWDTILMVASVNSFSRYHVLYLDRLLRIFARLERLLYSKEQCRVHTALLTESFVQQAAHKGCSFAERDGVALQEASS